MDFENLNTNPEQDKSSEAEKVLGSEPSFEEHMKRDFESNKQKTPEDRLFYGDDVKYGGYKVASQPYKTQSEAYKDIAEHWQGVDDVTTYFHNGKWYIIDK